MKRLVLLLMILVSLNAYSQYELDTTRIKIVPATFEMLLEEVRAEKDTDFEANTENIVTVQSKYTQEQIDRFLDTTFAFFIYDGYVYSKPLSVNYSGIVDACRYLENSKLSKNEVNIAFKYLVEWWDYHVEYNSVEPKKESLSQNIIALLNTDNDYSKMIEQIQIFRKTVFDEKYTKTEKNTMFEAAAKKIGMPENEISGNNPFSDDYNPFSILSGKNEFKNLMLDIELQQKKDESAKSKEELAQTLSKGIPLTLVLLTLEKRNLQLGNNSSKDDIIKIISYLKKNLLCFHWGDEQEYKNNLKWFAETVDFFKNELDITDAEIENEMKNQEELDFRWDEKQKVYILYGTKDN